MSLVQFANNYRWVLWATIVILVLFAAIAAVDFGQQPDEAVLLKKVSDSVKFGLLITDWHFYPTFYYYLATVCLTPELIQHHGFSQENLLSPKVADFLVQLGEFALSKSFLIRTRIVFICVSSLALLWCFLLVYTWRKNAIEALLATSVLGFSVEVVNHMRWLAPDTLVMQWTALTILCLSLATQSKQVDLYLKFAAIGAGLACGTKYTAGALLIPVWLSVWLLPTGSKKNRLRLSLVTLILFGLSYYLTTPGTLLNPLRFAYCISQQKKVYLDSGFSNYSVPNFWSHLLSNLGYFASAVFSKFWLISLSAFLAAVVGTVSLIREAKNRFIIIFFFFPVFHLLFMSASKVFFVRNLIILVPFFAVLAARGICWVLSGIRNGYAKVIFSGVVVAFICLNAYFILHDALEVRDQASINYLKRALDYVDRHPGQVFLLSPLVQQQMKMINERARGNTRLEPNASDINSVVFYFSEIQNSKQALKVGKFNYAKWFGPPFVNYNYYPTWPGTTIRIAVMPIREAEKLNLFYAA